MYIYALLVCPPMKEGQSKFYTIVRVDHTEKETYVAPEGSFFVRWIPA
jgi:hypothetical protein